MSITAYAQTQFLVAAGSSSGTYKEFLKEIIASTPDSGLTFQEVSSHGAVENLDLLINNKVMGAFLHADVIAHRNKNEPNAQLDKKFQTLLPLFTEEVHFVALTESKRKVGGTLGYGAKPVVIKTIDDLSNLNVGAAGGGWITANMVKFLSDIPFRVLPTFTSGADVLSALDKGEIDAAVFVGAAPLPNLEKLDSKYKILAIQGTTADKLKQQYQSSSVTYTKMSPSPVPTVASQCIFVSKVYKSKVFVNALSQFRTSFFDNLDTIKETPGNHPKWNSVSIDNRGPWVYLELGTNAPAVK
jgi:TRAP-type uncharacterized transport system substrate-binding protein